ncbi:MAG: hypothetical protein WCT39_02135 [Candidatus Margulisiibacteriota bacterium]
MKRNQLRAEPLTIPAPSKHPKTPRYPGTPFPLEGGKSAVRRTTSSLHLPFGKRFKFDFHCLLPKHDGALYLTV